MERRTPRMKGSIAGVEGGLAIALAMFAISMVAFFRVPLLPVIGDDLVMSVSELGLITTMFALGRLAVDIPAGRLADRIRPRDLMAVSALLVAGGSILLSGAQVPLVAQGAAVLLGVGSALTNTTGMLYFTTRAPIERRGKSVAVFAVTLLAGQAFGPTIGGAIASIGTWRVAEVVAGLAAVIIGMLVLERRGSRSPEEDDNPKLSSSPNAGVIPWRTRAVLFAVPFALFGTFGATLQTLVPIIGDENLDLSTGRIGLALGVGGLFRLIGVVIGGQISDRVSRKSALVPALGLEALGVTLLAVGSGDLLWLAGIAVISLASFAVSVSATMLADLSPPSGVGRNLGVYRFVGDIGLVISPVVAGRLFESFGPEAALLPLASLLGLVGLMVAFQLPETRWL